MKQHARTRAVVGALVGGLILGSAGLTPGLASASPTTVSFVYTGAAQSWTVPAGVTSITVDMAGGAGASAAGGGAGGAGGRVQGAISVSPGENLTVEVGGRDGYPDGGAGGSGTWYDGGSGGGASILASGTNQLAIAGGGGGGGGGSYDEAAGTFGYGAPGGAGGGQSGIPGTSVAAGGDGGGGGSQSQGGQGGASGYLPGSPGASGAGGAGGQGVTWSSGSMYYYMGGGGGGGGGYFGGGGGGPTIGAVSGGGAGGGGGSSLVPVGGTTTPGFETSNGYVTISYTVSSPSFTSSASALFIESAASTFTVTTSGASPISITASGALPPGLSLLSSNNGTATISGTPTGPVGNYTLDLTASNGYGSASQQLVVSVTSATASSSGSAVTTGTGNATGTLDAGTLSFASTPANLTFPAVSLDGSNQSTSAALPIDIADATGSGAGWNVTITSTQFSDGSGTLPVTATSVNAAPSASCDTGASCTPATLASSVSYPVTIPAGATAPTATRLYSAAAGSGMGDQTFSPTFTLAVLANAVAGAYSSDWTVSLVSGP